MALAGSDLSLMLDTEGVVHIAYTFGSALLGDTLQHAWSENDAFKLEVIDDRGRANKSWVRGAPELRVVYNNYGYASTAFQSIRSEGGGWSQELIDVVADSAGVSGVWRGGELELAFASHASIGIEQSAWRYEVSFAGSTLPEQWTRRSQHDGSADVAAGIDAAGVAHVVYTMPVDQGLKLSLDAPREVFYTTVRSGEWSAPEMLSTAPGYHGGLSLVIDGDAVHVVYTTTQLLSFEPTTASSEINYVTRPAAHIAWRRETVPSAGHARTARESLAVADGLVQLVYCDLSADGLRCNGLNLTMLQGTTWGRESIDQGCEDLGDLATLALGPDGSTHVAYQGCDRRLMYARR
jgi:hypothetical protein